MDKPKMTPKDFFMYFGTAVSLYASAGALLALLFSIIDTLVPDALNPQYVASWATSGMRFAISTLLVAFPLYIILSWLIRKDIAGNIEKYQLSIRKWFVYFTLFVAGATIAGDIIALVNSYLGGEVSARFIWKMLSVFVVAAVVFAYYFYDIRRAAAGDTKVNKTLIIVAVIGVLAAVISGFIVAGSPSDVRALRFDEQRVGDLSSIQWQVVNYYQSHGAMPATLDALNDDISGYKVPVDPETGAAYEYTSSAWLKFQICATFTKSNTAGVTVGESKPMPVPVYGGPTLSDNFTHDAGRVCFDRTIDPSQYPIFKK
jgi:hypothetical protein